MPKDRVERTLRYCQETKRKYIKQPKKKTRLSYRMLTDKQKAFKREVDQGVDPAEAVKRVYGTTSTTRKLDELKQHPVLAISFDKYMADLEDVGLGTKYRAQKFKEMTDKTDKKSTPHADMITERVLEHLDKIQGFDVQRSESRSLNININMTEEQMDFFLRKQKEMEKEKEKEEAVDGS